MYYKITQVLCKKINMKKGNIDTVNKLEIIFFSVKLTSKYIRLINILFICFIVRIYVIKHFHVIYLVTNYIILKLRNINLTQNV